MRKEEEEATEIIPAIESAFAMNTSKQKVKSFVLQLPNKENEVNASTSETITKFQILPKSDTISLERKLTMGPGSITSYSSSLLSKNSNKKKVKALTNSNSELKEKNNALRNELKNLKIGPLPPNCHQSHHIEKSKTSSVDESRCSPVSFGLDNTAESLSCKDNNNQAINRAKKFRSSSSFCSSSIVESKVSNVSCNSNIDENDERLKAIKALKDVAVRQESALLKHKEKLLKYRKELKAKDEKVSSLQWAVKELRQKIVMTQRQLREGSKETEMKLKEKDNEIFKLEKEKEEIEQKCSSLMIEVAECHEKIQQMNSLIAKSESYDSQDNQLIENNTEEKGCFNNSEKIEKLEPKEKIKLVLEMEKELNQMMEEVKAKQLKKKNRKKKIKIQESNEFTESEEDEEELCQLLHTVSSKKERIKKNFSLMNSVDQYNEDLHLLTDRNEFWRTTRQYSENMQSSTSYDHSSDDTLEEIEKECEELRNSSTQANEELQRVQNENFELTQKIKFFEKNYDSELIKLTKKLNEVLMENAALKKVRLNAETISQVPTAQVIGDIEHLTDKHGGSSNSSNIKSATKKHRTLSETSFDSLAILNHLTSFSYDDISGTSPPAALNTNYFHHDREEEENIDDVLEYLHDENDNKDLNAYTESVRSTKEIDKIMVMDEESCINKNNVLDMDNTSINTEVLISNYGDVSLLNLAAPNNDCWATSSTSSVFSDTRKVIVCDNIPNEIQKSITGINDLNVPVDKKLLFESSSTVSTLSNNNHGSTASNNRKKSSKLSLKKLRLFGNNNLASC